MDFIYIIGVGITVLMLTVILRQYKSEYAVIAVIIFGVLLFLKLADGVYQILGFINNIADSAKLSADGLVVAVKVLGIAYITQIACDMCRDFSENALASKLEIGGKITILVMALPLFRQVLSSVMSFAG